MSYGEQDTVIQDQRQAGTLLAPDLPVEWAGTLLAPDLPVQWAGVESYKVIPVQIIPYKHVSSP